MQRGLSLIALRDSAALPPDLPRGACSSSVSNSLAEGPRPLRASGDARAWPAADQCALASRASRGFDLTAAAAANVAPADGAAAASGAAPSSSMSAGVETVQGRQIRASVRGKALHSLRLCVTWAPRVFLANVQGPWIHPDAVSVERLVEVAHACPRARSGIGARMARRTSPCRR